MPNIPVYAWQDIETAPEGEDLWLEVVGIHGDTYSLPFACRRSGSVFITAKGSHLQVRPVRWKTFFAPYVSSKPKSKRAALPT